MSNFISAHLATHELPTLTPEQLGTRACVLSLSVLEQLGPVLAQHRLLLTQELGFSMDGCVLQELRAWCRRPGSTVWLLDSVLKRAGRQDCLAWIRTDLERNHMYLYVREECPPTPPRLHRVPTNGGLTLQQALQDYQGGHLTQYQIVGPESWLTWDSMACKLKGQQLSLRRQSESTEESSTEPKHLSKMDASDNQTYQKRFDESSNNFGDETLPKQLDVTNETNVKEVYTDGAATFEQPESMNWVPSHSDNNSRQEEAVSDQALVRTPVALETVGYQYYSTNKVFSRNMQSEVGMKTLPDKLVVSDSLQGEPTRCHGEAWDQDHNVAKLSMPNPNAWSKNQNNLNQVSVSTAFLSVINPIDCSGAPAKSFPERPRIDLSPEGELSPSNNQTLEDDPPLYRPKRDQEESGHYLGEQANSEEVGETDVVMDGRLTSVGPRESNACDPTFSTLSSQPAELYGAADMFKEPPLKRQRSSIDMVDQGNFQEDVGSTEHGSPGGEDNAGQPLEVSPELDTEIRQLMDGAQDHPFSVEMHPLAENPYCYTPPPARLSQGKLHHGSSQPRSNVPQTTDGVQTHPPSITTSHLRGSSQSSGTETQVSSSTSSRSSWSNRLTASSLTQHSAPAELPPPSSDHYLTMRQPAPGPPPPHRFSTTTTRSLTEQRLFLQCDSIPIGGGGATASAVPWVGSHNQFGSALPRGGFNLNSQAVRAQVPRQQPFFPAPHLTHIRHPTQVGNICSGPQPQHSTSKENGDHYNTISSEEESICGASQGQVRGQADPMSVCKLRPPRRIPPNLQQQLPGWCPDVNGDNVEETMKDFLHQDGAFIVWLSRRHDNFMITLSHKGKLVYLRVFELLPRTRGGGPIYYLFEEGYRTENIISLVQYYRERGLRLLLMVDGHHKTELVWLKTPLKVRLERRRRR